MEKKWFKAKRYGYGWYPATWQGWLVLAIHIAIVIVAVLQIPHYVTEKQIILWVTVPVLLSTAILIYICYKTGEKARWRWGEKDEEKE